MASRRTILSAMWRAKALIRMDNFIRDREPPKIGLISGLVDGVHAVVIFFRLGPHGNTWVINDGSQPVAERNVTEPSQLKESWEQLDKAVNRLEAAQVSLTQKVEQQGAASPDSHDENKNLQDQNRNLQEVNDAVSKRLDSVIDRLKSVLEV